MLRKESKERIDDLSGYHYNWSLSQKTSPFLAYSSNLFLIFSALFITFGLVFIIFIFTFCSRGINPAGFTIYSFYFYYIFSKFFIYSYKNRRLKKSILFVLFSNIKASFLFNVLWESSVGGEGNLYCFEPYNFWAKPHHSREISGFFLFFLFLFFFLMG